MRALFHDVCCMNARFSTGAGKLSAWPVEPQVRNSLEVADVAGNKRQAMVLRSRSDQQIKIGDEEASSPEIGANVGKAFHDVVVERE